MNEANSTLQPKTGGTDVTRFNALRHGVLSRYTVLPWEDSEEYSALVGSLVAEHQPQGPTEEHLVEELAGVLWRKRRLRLAEAAAHRGLESTFSSYRDTAKAALAHITKAEKPIDVSEAVHVTPADTQDEVRDLDDDEAMTLRALDLLGSRRNDAHETALAELRDDTQSWWADTLAQQVLGKRLSRRSLAFEGLTVVEGAERSAANSSSVASASAHLCRHRRETLNETDRDEVTRDLVAWLDGIVGM